MPTITVRKFTYDELKNNLNPGDRILILSCNACAKQSDGLGGEQGLQALADKLTADGFNVRHREVLPVACSPTQLRDRLQGEETRRLFEDADIIIPLACRAGEERVSEEVPGVHILRVTKTLGKGTYSPKTGARLTEPLPDVGLETEDFKGLSLAEAAKRLGLQSGSF
jgi:hypothetical protein